MTTKTRDYAKGERNPEADRKLTVSVTIRVSPDLADRMEAAARRAEWTVGHCYRAAAYEWLKSEA